VVVCEVATDQALLDLPGATTDRAAFSPDGRCFAWADAQRLLVWDLPTGKVVVERTAPGPPTRHGNWASAGVAFAPDGRTVATGQTDGTILLWDVAAYRWALAPTAVERDACWNDLAGADAARAFRAVGRLAADPAATVAWLRERCRPAAAIPAADWQAWLADLDSPTFTRREAAARQLAEAGGRAEPILRAALERQLSAEARRRIEVLLARSKSRLTAQELREARAVWVLECIGTAAARELLQALADGDPSARSTHEARAALHRLTHRPTPLG
jgi:hypothetical protein